MWMCICMLGLIVGWFNIFELEEHLKNDVRNATFNGFDIYGLMPLYWFVCMKLIYGKPHRGQFNSKFDFNCNSFMPRRVIKHSKFC